ncbi:MAG: hypothetical protein U5L05_16305 [Rubrivivax sp.]|nr:hypothetical protein [Rubrivivax sp.]
MPRTHAAQVTPGAWDLVQALAASHPALVLVYPGDYTLIASRAAFMRRWQGAFAAAR